MTQIRLLSLAAGLSLMAALAGCQSPPRTGALGRNMLACRQAGLVERIHGGGSQFQRLADDAMASGQCRVFRAGQPVGNLETRGGYVGFVDPASGRAYWAAR